MYRVFVFIMLFFIYSFLGWMMEMIVCFPQNKKFVNRGFLIGPICPIYGFGCLLIIILLDKYKTDPIALFCMAVILCSVLEYLTSYLLEKIFKTRWWDYSHLPFNINGRICVMNMVAFGILGVLVMYYVNPFFLDIIHMINPVLLKVIGSILFILFFIDLCISTKIIYNIKGVGIKLLQDSTEEINAKVKEALMSKGILTRRIAKAFPNFSIRKRVTKKMM